MIPPFPRHACPVVDMFKRVDITTQHRFLDHAKNHIRDRRREMNATVSWIHLRFILFSCFLRHVFLRAPGVRRSPDWMILQRALGSRGVRFQSCAPALFLDARTRARARKHARTECTSYFYFCLGSTPTKWVLQLSLISLSAHYRGSNLTPGFVGLSIIFT